MICGYLARMRFCLGVVDRFVGLTAAQQAAAQSAWAQRDT